MDGHTIDTAAALELLPRLMSVPGRSREERAIVELIRAILRECGLSDSAMEIDSACTRIPGGGEIGNLIVRLPGTVSGPRRLLMAHVDTVPICVGCDPVIDGDCVRSRNPQTGLGGDNRGGVGVILTALREILKHKYSHPPLTFFFPVQEEIGLNGARYVSVNLLGSPELCFNWDGGDPSQVCVGATGAFALEIDIEGLASHAGVHPERGISAISIAALAIAELTQNGWHGLIEKGNDSGTSNIGVISGGEATNVVTPNLQLCAEARSHDPEFRQKIVDTFRDAFERAAGQVRSADGRAGRVSLRSELKYESFRLSTDTPVVRHAMSAVASIGLTPATRIGNGGLDANWMTAHGLPTVTLGCGQNEIHTTSETLSVPAYLQACQVALRLASGE